jgi:Putative helicase
MFLMDAKPDNPGLEQPLLKIARSKDDLINDASIRPYARQIFDIVAVPTPHFQTLYLSPIANYLALTQHSCHEDIVTRLQAITDGLKLRRSLILPLGGSPEIANDKSDVWTYAVFVSLLLYNVASEILSHQVMVNTQNNRGYKKWCPFTDPLQPPHHFKVTKKRPTSQYASIVLAPLILNEQGLEWLSDDNSILNTVFELMISPKPSNPLGALILKVYGLEATKTNEAAKRASSVEPETPKQSKNTIGDKHHQSKVGRQFRHWLMAEIGNTNKNNNIYTTTNGVSLIDPEIFIQYAREQKVEN